MKEQQDVNGNVRDDAAVSSEDNTLLLVRGNTGDSQEDKMAAKAYIKNLSQAISTVVEKFGSATLRCVGAAALNNAVKAEIIAAGEMMKRGKNIVVIPSFKTVKFGDNERTALVLLVKPV